MNDVKNIDLAMQAIAATMAAKAVRAMIKDAPQMRYECIQCHREIPPGKPLRRCPACRAENNKPVADENFAP